MYFTHSHNEYYTAKYALTGCFFASAVICNVFPTPRKYDKAHMFSLAVRIRSKLLQPFGLGHDLLTDMQNYIKELEILKNGINEEDAEALNAFDRIKNQGGPVHLLLRPVDSNKLADFYKWDKPTRGMFEDIFEQTLLMWNDLQVMTRLVKNEDIKDGSSDTSNF